MEQHGTRHLAVFNGGSVIGVLLVRDLLHPVAIDELWTSRGPHKRSSHKNERVKTIAIVSHDNKKQDLLAWAKYNRETPNGHRVVATGTTGALLEAELNIPFFCVLRGPLGGDQ